MCGVVGSQHARRQCVVRRVLCGGAPARAAAVCVALCCVVVRQHALRQCVVCRLLCGGAPARAAACLLDSSPSSLDPTLSRIPSSAW